LKKAAFRFNTMQKILFLCTGNSARSQMSESILRALGDGQYEVHSAGTEPGPQVHPAAIAVLKEKDFSTEGLYPKKVTEFLNEEIDLVITVCDNAKQTCPHFPGAKRYVHWSLEDPAHVEGAPEKVLAVFRATRDEIERRIRTVILKESI
jgi:arsenate reductase